MKILVVEDEPIVAFFLEESLLEADIRYDLASTADEAVHLLETDGSITHVLTDIDMPGSMDGLRLSHVVRSRWPPVHLIVMSGKHRLTSKDLPERAVFLPKPFPTVELYRAIRSFSR